MKIYLNDFVLHLLLLIKIVFRAPVIALLLVYSLCHNYGEIILGMIYLEVSC